MRYRLMTAQRDWRYVFIIVIIFRSSSFWRSSHLFGHSVDITTKRNDASTTHAMRFLRELRHTCPEILQQNESLIVRSDAHPLPLIDPSFDLVYCGVGRLLREARKIYAGDNCFLRKMSRGHGHVHRSVILPHPSITAFARDHAHRHHMIIQNLNLHSPANNFKMNFEIRWRDLGPSFLPCPLRKQTFTLTQPSPTLITGCRHHWTPLRFRQPHPTSRCHQDPHYPQLTTRKIREFLPPRGEILTMGQPMIDSIITNSGDSKRAASEKVVHPRRDMAIPVDLQSVRVNFSYSRHPPSVTPTRHLHRRPRCLLVARPSLWNLLIRRVPGIHTRQPPSQLAS